MIVTVVVATTMTAGKLEVAILRETDTLKETTEIKQGILPLREDMERETGVTTEREVCQMQYYLVVTDLDWENWFLKTVTNLLFNIRYF